MKELCPLHSTQGSKCAYDLLRPICNFILAQGAIERLKSRPQKNRVLARSDRTAAKNLYWNETTQFFKALRFYCGLNPFKRDRIREHKGKIAFHRRELGRGSDWDFRNFRFYSSSPRSSAT